MTMRLLWNDDDKPGEIRANSQVWADDGNPLPYVLSYGPKLDEWTACFESTQIARGTLSACLAACESAEEASPVELGNIDEVERLRTIANVAGESGTTALAKPPKRQGTVIDAEKEIETEKHYARQTESGLAPSSFLGW
jgi:hypothetical protein